MQLFLPRSAGALRLLRHVWLRWAESSPGGEEEVDAVGAAAGVRADEDVGEAEVGAPFCFYSFALCLQPLAKMLKVSFLLKQLWRRPMRWSHLKEPHWLCFHQKLGAFALFDITSL